MSRYSRLLVLVAALGMPLTALAASPTAGADAPAPAAVTSPSPRPAGVEPERVLTDDVIRPQGSPRSARVRTWPGTRIRYHETIPRKWDWSLDRAIHHWNSSGGKIKFVEVSKSRAQLVIRYGPTYGSDGIATIGYQYRNFVHLSPAYKRADELDPEIRVWVGRLFTHELGHVLGFDHTGGQCALMYPVYDFGLCPPLPEDKPGYYHCRWIDKKLLDRFTRIYGGSPRRPAQLCLIEALPGQLHEVRFSGGQTQDKAVRIDWRPPSKIRAGTKVRVTVWKGDSCAGRLPDTWERRVAVDAREGRWTDPAYGQGNWCYRLQIENRYGATRPPHSQAMQRYAPVPGVPQIGTVTWDQEAVGYRFTWTAPMDTWLYVMRGEPGGCPTAFDQDDAEHLGDERLVSAGASSECLSFFAVTAWDTVSSPTQVEVAAPTAGAPDIGALTWYPDDYSYRFTWQQPDPSTDLQVMRSYDDPTACVTTYDETSADYVSNVEGNTWQVSGYAIEECLTFFAVTSWGTASPGRSVRVEVPSPDVTPVVGPVATDPANPSAATATVTLPHDAYRIGIEVVAGSCPDRAPVDAAWWDGWDAGSDRWVFLPESPEAGGDNCALFTAVDPAHEGLHGPVVMRPFSVPAP